MNIDEYVRSIHSVVKRDYAIAWYDHAVGNRPQPEERRYPIGYMARQAVRITIAKIIAKAEESKNV